MTTLIQITIAAALILSIIIPFGTFFLGEKNRKRYKNPLPATVSFSSALFWWEPLLCSEER